MARPPARRYRIFRSVCKCRCLTTLAADKRGPPGVPRKANRATCLPRTINLSR
jgi:uracil-DNA glycosylase